MSGVKSVLGAEAPVVPWPGAMVLVPAWTWECVSFLDSCNADNCRISQDMLAPLVAQFPFSILMHEIWGHFLKLCGDHVDL